MTPLDSAHAAMSAAPGDADAERAFFARLVDAELFLLLTEEARGDAISPQIFDVSEGRFVLVFDTAERLSAFAGESAFAALSGRALAGMLQGQGLGLGLNLEVAPSSTLLPAEAVDWLNERTFSAPKLIEAGLSTLSAPQDVPESLLHALDAKFAAAEGLAEAAFLVSAEYRDGSRNHVIAFSGAAQGAQAALARAVNEALEFSGTEAGTLDVTFLEEGSPLAISFAEAGLKFDLPQAPVRPRKAPGMDRDKPPILR